MRIASYGEAALYHTVSRQQIVERRPPGRWLGKQQGRRVEHRVRRRFHPAGSFSLAEIEMSQVQPREVGFGQTEPKL